MDRLLGKIDGNRFPQMGAVICLHLAYSLPTLCPLQGPLCTKGNPWAAEQLCCLAAGKSILNAIKHERGAEVAYRDGNQGEVVVADLIVVGRYKHRP